MLKYFYVRRLLLLGVLSPLAALRVNKISQRLHSLLVTGKRSSPVPLLFISMQIAGGKEREE